VNQQQVPDPLTVICDFNFQGPPERKPSNRQNPDLGRTGRYANRNSPIVSSIVRRLTSVTSRAGNRRF